MRSTIKLVLLTLGFVIAGSMINSAFAERTAGRGTPVAPAPSTDALFRQKCSKCHGVDGDGDTSMGRIFNSPDFTDAGWWAKHSNRSELIGAITRGKKSMPAFGRKLTRAQIAALADYVQHFKR